MYIPIMRKIFTGVLAEQDYRQSRFIGIWKEKNCCRMNRRAVEDRVGEPKTTYDGNEKLQEKNDKPQCYLDRL